MSHTIDQRRAANPPAPQAVFTGNNGNPTDRASIAATAMGFALLIPGDSAPRTWQIFGAGPLPHGMVTNAEIVIGAMILLFGLVWYNLSISNRLDTAKRELSLALEEQAKLKEESRRNIQANQDKTSLLLMAAHDLRSPLAGMLLGSEMLRSGYGSDPEAADDLLNQIGSSIHHMDRIVDDLMEMQAVEDGRRPLHLTSLDACGVLNDAVRTHVTTAQRKRVSISAATPSAQALCVSDVAALRRIIDNLITNAIKYSYPGTEVTVRLDIAGSDLTISVSDRGPGVNPEHGDKIFTKYERGRAQPTGGEKSFGLGLWIVKSLVTALHGTAHVTNRVGGGSTFLVVLPTNITTADRVI